MVCKYLGLYGKCKKCVDFSVENDNNYFWESVCIDKHNLNLWKMCEKYGELSNKPSRIVNPLESEYNHCQYHIDKQVKEGIAL